jgi:hypothetical protein
VVLLLIRNRDDFGFSLGCMYHNWVRFCWWRAEYGEKRKVRKCFPFWFLSSDFLHVIRVV